MAEQLPKRLADQREREERLTNDLAAQPNAEITTASMTIDFWLDDAGRQRVRITSDTELTPLQAKGLLHDALYSLVHTDPITTRSGV